MVRQCVITHGDAVEREHAIAAWHLIGQHPGRFGLQGKGHDFKEQ